MESDLKLINECGFDSFEDVIKTKKLIKKKRVKKLLNVLYKIITKKI